MAIKMKGWSGSPMNQNSPMKQGGVYECPECDEVFELPEDLMYHMEIHLSGDTGTGTPGSQYTGVKRNTGGSGGGKKKGLFRRRD